MSLKELADDEKAVFAALVRLMVRLDMNFSDEEAGAIQKISNELGHKDFWALMEKSATADTSADDVLARAKSVERKEAQELIYGNLYELSVEGGIEPAEAELLDRLAAQWSLEISQQDPDAE